MQREVPAPSEAAQAACGSGQVSLSPGPACFSLAVATSCCLGWEHRTQLFARVVPSCCCSVWSVSSCSAELPSAASPALELPRPLGLCGAVRCWRCWKLLLAVAIWGCHTRTLQCQESRCQPWIR